MTYRVFGIPLAQGRPRAALIAGKVRVYDPKASRDWKRTVHAQVLDQLPKGSQPTRQPISVFFTFYLIRPKSLPKKVIWPAKRPDLENYIKGTMDALQGLLFSDDAQVVRLEATKVFDPRPGVSIRVEELA
jgi:Holliday junction resolvase RusA-like endonuclease